MEAKTVLEFRTVEEAIEFLEGYRGTLKRFIEESDDRGERVLLLGKLGEVEQELKRLRGS